MFFSSQTEICLAKIGILMDSIRIYMGLAKIWKSNGKNWDDFKVKETRKSVNYTMMDIRK